MRAHAELCWGARGQARRMVDSPPVAWRLTPEAVYLVGTAGGPTGDDDVTIGLDVDAGAHLVVRSSAAMVVYAGTGTTQRIEARLAEGASLDWAPEPIIVTSGAHHTTSALVSLDETARLDWTELIVLGRHDEMAGHADLRLDCVVAGRALLRHQLSVGGAPGWRGPAVLAGRRAAGVRLVAGPTLEPPPVRQGHGWAWMQLEGPGWLLTAVAADLASLRESMAEAGWPKDGDGGRVGNAGEPERGDRVANHHGGAPRAS